MCGIAGLFTRQSDNADRSKLDATLTRLAHRGPNGQGVVACPVGAGQLLLGHRRLSIIDLSDAGLQPMTSSDGRYTVCFNGEIYNYIELRAELQTKGRRFETKTDTEVLLEAWSEWGVDCLRRLDGMFAMAMFDRQTNNLFCVRDPFGIKPFFYSLSEKAFGFASEIPALLELGLRAPRMNRARAHAFLCWGDYDDGADTFYDDVFQLKPGQLMVLDLAQAEPPTPQIAQWWWPDVTERTDLSFADAADQLRQLLLTSVRRQLRSDVPLAVTLSGGLDSSAIACAVRHLEPDFPIHTFTYDASEPRLSERKWANIVNDHIGSTPHWIDDASGDMGGELDDIIRAQGEPFGSTSIAAGYRVVKLAHDHGITVTLDGQGADELLAGYDGYPAAVIRSHLDRQDYSGLLRFARRWQSHPGRTWRWAALHFGEAVVPVGLREAFFKMAGHTPTPDWLNVDRLRDAGVEPGPPTRLPQIAEARGRRLTERMRTALTVNRLPALLRHGDRNSMRWSIESRVPFLTPDIARFTLSLPEHYLLSPRAQTKHVFRAAMRGIVPDVILDRQDKIGFETPEFSLLNRDRAQINHWLSAADGIDFINAEPLRRQVARVLDGEVPFSFKAWRMINYCRWVSLQSCGIT